MPSAKAPSSSAGATATDLRKPEHVGEPQPDEADVALLERAEHELLLLVHAADRAVPVFPPCYDQRASPAGPVGGARSTILCRVNGVSWNIHERATPMIPCTPCRARTDQGDAMRTPSRPARSPPRRRLHRCLALVCRRHPGRALRLPGSDQAGAAGTREQPGRRRLEQAPRARRCRLEQGRRHVEHGRHLELTVLARSGHESGVAQRFGHAALTACLTLARCVAPDPSGR